ncbi:MAG: T9SS type A sorting domain-containing protein, partial [Chitinophagaceae bacterium]
IVAPVGNHTAQVPLLLGSDPEDQPATGSLSGKTIRIASVPANGNLYYNGGLLAAGALIPAYDPALLQVDPDNLITQLSFSYEYLDAAGIASNLSTVTMDFRYETITGHVYHDPNGVTDAGGGLVSGTPLSSVGADPLYVSLIDPENAGTILATAAVQSNGAYSFNSIVPAGDLKLALHTIPGDYTSGGSLDATLPSGWSYAGKQRGTTAGVNIDLPVNGNFPLSVVASPFANVNFAVEQTPQADSKIYFITQPSVNQVITLNGSATGTAIPPNQLTGSDPEDAPAAQGLNGDNANRRVQLVSIPANGELRYNGSAVAAGDIITQYDKGLLSVALTGTGYTGISFSYVYLDAANVASNTATYAINWGSPLPVTWLSFTATEENQSVLLEWKTATETNNAGFYIERSTDARTWETIAFVASAYADGNAAQVTSYRHTDQSPVTGTNYYRLKQTDRNGRFEYSVTRSAVIRKTALSFSPNPVKSVLRVTGCESGDQLQIVSLDGKILMSQRSSGNTMLLSVARLPAGTYIVKVHSSGRLVSSMKFVKE